MKKQIGKKRILVIMAIIVGGGNLWAGEDAPPQSSFTSSQEMRRLEANWQTQQPVAYYALVNDSINEMSTNVVPEDVNGKAASLLGHVLSKGVGSKEGVVREDLAVIERLAQLLISVEDTATSEERRTNMVLLATCLKCVKKAHVEGYKPKKVYMNISPPYISSGYNKPVMAGMDPEAIIDPEMKAQYLNALRENARNGDENVRQMELEVLQRPLRRILVFYMEISAMKRSSALEDMKTRLESAGFSDEEIQREAAKWKALATDHSASGRN